LPAASLNSAPTVGANHTDVGIKHGTDQGVVALDQVVPELDRPAPPVKLEWLLSHFVKGRPSMRECRRPCSIHRLDYRERPSTTGWLRFSQYPCLTVFIVGVGDERAVGDESKIFVPRDPPVLRPHL
jgi:hypothetical protein